jgi:hypothetical protein
MSQQLLFCADIEAILAQALSQAGYVMSTAMLYPYRLISSITSAYCPR